MFRQNNFLMDKIMLYNVNKLLMLDIRKVLDILFIRNFQTDRWSRKKTSEHIWNKFWVSINLWCWFTVHKLFIILSWPKSSFGFSITSYGKSKQPFWSTQYTIAIHIIIYMKNYNVKNTFAGHSVQCKDESNLNCP